MEIRAIILAGGKGTRLKDVLKDRPKPMAEICGKPFIEWIMIYFERQGINNFTISLGHMAENAKDYFLQRDRIDVVIEKYTLGTGGAFLYAVNQMAKNDIYVLSNGDSVILADLLPVWKMLKDDNVDGVIIGRKMEDASRYGTLSLAEDKKIISFSEKRQGEGVINGGIYFFKSRLIELLPKDTPMSIETDGIPKILELGANIFVHATDAPFIDIGTPETYEEAENFIKTYF